MHLAGMMHPEDYALRANHDPNLAERLVDRIGHDYVESNFDDR